MTIFKVQSKEIEDSTVTLFVCRGSSRGTWGTWHMRCNIAATGEIIPMKESDLLRIIPK